MGSDAPHGYLGDDDPSRPAITGNGAAPADHATNLVDGVAIEAVLINQTEPGLVFQFRLGDQVYDPILVTDLTAILAFFEKAGSVSANIMDLLAKRAVAQGEAQVEEAGEQEPKEEGAPCAGECGRTVFGEMKERGFCQPCFDELSEDEQWALQQQGRTDTEYGNG